jgi:hypothetical protein
MPSSIKVEDSYVDAKSAAMTELQQSEKTEIVLDEDTRKMEKRIVRKLDMTLMPVVWVLYFFNYMDRNNIAYVKEDDLRNGPIN